MKTELIETDYPRRLMPLTDQDRIVALEKKIEKLQSQITGIHDWMLDQTKLNEGFIDLLKKY